MSCIPVKIWKTRINGVPRPYNLGWRHSRIFCVAKRKRFVEKEAAYLISSASWGSSTRGLGTLIAVIMRYPEISSVQYNVEDSTLSATFLLRRTLEPQPFETLVNQLVEVLETYRLVTRRPLKAVEVRHVAIDQVTEVELIRDIETLSVEEIGMTIEVLRDAFTSDLILDSHDLLEEELLLQEENIQAGLEALKRDDARRLVALRDEGRLMVFNT